MQKMSGSTDTHDHGPPANTSSIAQQASSALGPHTPLSRVAIWTTGLSNTSVNSFAGAMAGIASGVVTCPLDVIKTKLQAQGGFTSPALGQTSPKSSVLYRGMVGTARVILQQDGLRGMYRGLGPMLLGYLPTWAVYMSVYDSSREHFYKSGYGSRERDKWIARIYASLLAGATSTLITNPIWVIKTRLMAQVSRTAAGSAVTPWHYTSTADAVRKMYRAEGLAAFYSGLSPAMLGLTHVAIQFPLYEYFKQKFTGLEMGAVPTEHGETGKNTLGILAATFLSKICATSATYPHEVLRTRLQTQQRHLRHVDDGRSSGAGRPHHAATTPAPNRIASSDGRVFEPRYKGVVRTCRIILREEGWRAFYNGMGTNMIRAVPAAMTTMLTFETVKGLIGNLQEEGKRLTGDDRS